MAVNDVVKDAIAAMLRKRDHLRKVNADPAKLAELDFQLRQAGYDPDAESKRSANPAKTADARAAVKDVKSADAENADADAKNETKNADAKSDSKAADAKAEPKTSAASANVPSGRTAPSKAKAA